MKRIGCIIEQIADMDNLREADKDAQDGKVKTNRYIRRHNLHAEEDLLKLRRMILNLNFPDPGYTSMDIKSDAGKVRTIVKQRYFPWRILHHAIMIVIGEDLYKNLIYDTFACVKGKGLHFGVKRMKRKLKEDPDGTRWFVKTDLKKFYQSIPHSVIIAALRRKFKDEKFIQLMEVAVLTYDSGEELEKILINEQRKKRCAYWSVHKPTTR